MTDRSSASGGLPVSRRDALKGLAGVGAASVLAQQSDQVASLLQSDDDRELMLPVENVREVWGHWDSDPLWDLRDRYTDIPKIDTEIPALVVATRGLKQTNIVAVDDTRSWRNDCKGVPGIEHRFTAIGYYRGVTGADLTISVDDSLVDDCGSVALTPNYFYYTNENTPPVEDAKRHTDHQQMVTDLEDQIDKQLSEEDPRHMESMIAAAELITGVLNIAARTPHPAVQVVSIGLTLASFLSSLSEPEFEHDIEPGKISLSIDSTRPISTFFVDFSVVVPADAEDVSVEVAHRIDGVDEGFSMMEPDDLTFTVDIPPIEHDQDVGDLTADHVPTIETSGEPLAVEEASDGTLTATAEPPDDAIDAKAWQVDDAYTGDRDTKEITTSALDQGVHSVRYVGHDPLDSSPRGAGYICERLVQTGDPYYYEISPSVVIEGPSTADVEETVTFKGIATSPNGIDSHRWEVLTDEQGVGTVPVDSQADDGAPDPFEVTLPGDNYRVELTVTGDSSEELTATATHQIRVFDRVYDVSIVAPETVPRDEPVPIEFEIDGEDEAELAYDVILWGGALNEAGESSLEHTFEETGEQTLELFVLDTDNNRGQAELTIEVVEEEDNPVEVSIDDDVPSEAEPGKNVTFEGSASSDNGAIDTYVWEVTRFPRTADKRQTEETKEGTAPVEDFETSLDGDVYDVHLHVTDEYGVTASAKHDLDVHRSLDVAIDAPSEIPVDESVTFSVDIVGEDEDDLAFEAINWSDAFNEFDTLETSQSFDSSGERTAEVRVITTDNARGTAEHSFDVIVEPPVAEIKGPDEGTYEEPFEEDDPFDGSDSRRSLPIEYEWTVDRSPNAPTGTQTDPGEEDLASGSGSTFDFTPDGDSAGTYVVKLTVEDTEGNTDETEHEVEVS